MERVGVHRKMLGERDTKVHLAVEALASLTEDARTLSHEVDSLSKAAARLIEAFADELESKQSGRQNHGVSSREANNARKNLEAAQKEVNNHLKDRVRYFYRQARWLQERFPGAELRDVPGLCKLVDRTEIEANDWSLTPGRYVGMALEVNEEGFNYEETLFAIHQELTALNSEALELADRIATNFQEYIS